MMTETITRRDGIIYTRKKKLVKEYNEKLNIRIKGESLNKLKEIAEKKQIHYSDIIRNLIDNYIESEV